MLWLIPVALTAAGSALQAIGAGAENDAKKKELKLQNDLIAQQRDFQVGQIRTAGVQARGGILGGAAAAGVTQNSGTIQAIAQASDQAVQADVRQAELNANSQIAANQQSIDYINQWGWTGVAAPIIQGAGSIYGTVYGAGSKGGTQPFDIKNLYPGSAK